MKLIIIIFILIATSQMAEGQTTTSSELGGTTDSVRMGNSGVVGLPFVIYSPETSFAFGVAGFYFAEDDTVLNRLQRPDEVSSYLMYTLKKQFAATFEVNKFYGQNDKQIVADFKFSKFPNKFYGIGNSARDEFEESYTQLEYRLRASHTWMVGDRIFLGPSYSFYHWDMQSTEEGGMLASGLIPGSVSTSISGLGATVTIDRRDGTFYPLGGYLFSSEMILYNRLLGSSLNFFRFDMNASYFEEILNSHVVALNGVATLSEGDIPFQRLAWLGGDEIMRGVFEGRYMDKNLLAVQMEYRFPLFWRFGGVAFAGTGMVANSIGRMSTSAMVGAIGLGGRFAYELEERLNLRLDMAYALGQFQFYFNIKEAF